MSSVAEVVTDFEGATPRVVADLQNIDFEVEYMRDDVENRYSNTDLEEAYRLVMSNQVAGDEFKDIIGENQYRAQTLFFEDIIVFLLPAERYKGVFASFDYDEDFPVNELVDRVSEARSES